MMVTGRKNRLMTEKKIPSYMLDDPLINSDVDQEEEKEVG
jgi:hypothetical protein